VFLGHRANPANWPIRISVFDCLLNISVEQRRDHATTLRQHDRTLAIGQRFKERVDTALTLNYFEHWFDAVSVRVLRLLGFRENRSPCLGQEFYQPSVYAAPSQEKASSHSVRSLDVTLLGALALLKA